jgi:pimeloyl-ACP methyl ester carboxylesterase
VRYLLAGLAHQRRARVTAIEPSIEAQQRDAADVDARMAGTVWMTGGCRSWCLDAPHQAKRARERLPHARHVDLPDYGHVPMSDAPDRVARAVLETTGAVAPA